MSANPAAAEAWARTLGIRASDIPWYLNTLSPVILTADTWVTNHSYRDGVARPFQSVLQAGTPVFIDGAGVPRAVCACGNPLRPPAAAPIGGYRVTGPQWYGYDSRTITRVATVNQYVTTVNNTTTVVNNPAPAPIGPLQITNLVTAALDTITVGGTLNLPAPPADVVLPDPVKANLPVSFDDADTARSQGLEPGSTVASTEMVDRAAENGNVPESASPSVSDDQLAPPSTNAPEAPASTSVPGPTDAGPTVPNAPVPNTPVPDTAAPDTTTTDAPTGGPTTSDVPTTATTTSAVPAATAFSGSGDTIGSLTFDAGGTSVTCTIPSTTDSSTVSASCSDDVDREFTTSSLGRDAVTAATDSSSVWSVSTVGGETLEVSAAVWQ